MGCQTFIAEESLLVSLEEVSISSRIEEERLDVDIQEVPQTAIVSPDKYDVNIVEEVLNAEIVEDHLDVDITESIIIRDEVPNQLHLEEEFNYTECSSPIVLGVALYPFKVQETVVEVLEAFDGSIGLTVGTDTSQAVLMALSDSNLQVTGTYCSSNNLQVTGMDVFKIFFNFTVPPTQGRAVVTIYFN